MSLNEEFIKSPAEFLAKHVVQVANTGQVSDKNPAGIRGFVFKLAPTKKEVASTTIPVQLADASKDEKDVIQAYWLPWKTYAKAELKLGNDANYFFTSQMTGCRLTVVTIPDQAPQTHVAHFAGTWNTKDRQLAEQEWIKAKGVPDTVKPRRLSRSGAFGKSAHSYDEKSSAFSYGVRDIKTGVWTFSAQVVDALMTEGFDFRFKSLPGIKTPFKFD